MVQLDRTATLDARLDFFGLAVSVDIDSNINSPSTFLQHLDTAIATHFSSHGLDFGSTVPSPDRPSDHIQYQSLPWKLLIGGYLAKGKRKLVNATIQGYQFGHAKLAQVAKKIPNAHDTGALLFICKLILKF